MRLFTPLIALFALPTTVLSVSLADFPPYLSGLPISCAIVYKQSIVGCSPSDFASSSSGCSAGCVRALQAFAPSVNTACANHNINGQNIIVAFLDNDGPASICHNADEILSSSSGTSTPTSSTAISSASAGTSTASPTSSTSANTSPTNATPPASSSTSLTTTVVPIPASSSVNDPATDLSSTPSTSAYRFSQTGMNDGSGGGSPFDTQGNLESGAHVVTYSVLISLITASVLLLAGFR